jgi:hypothetical protein
MGRRGQKPRGSEHAIRHGYYRPGKHGARPNATPARPTSRSFKNHLAADRTSCRQAEANQFRLSLHAGAYWLLWSLRHAMPRRSAWRVMRFDTLRLRLIEIAARVVELKTQIKVHLPTSAPDQPLTLPFLSQQCRSGIIDIDGGS